jgi:hypothetical protein
LKFIDDDGFETEDRLYLDKSIQEFTSLLLSTDYSVYSFTGDWGSGKTTFIKLWEQTLNPEDYIHIDAFQSDYITEPFIMLIRHFYVYLKTKKKIDQQLLDNFTAKAKAIFVRSAKVAGKAGLNIIASKLLGNENAEKILSDFTEILFDELVLNGGEEASLYEKLKEIVGKIAADLKLPLYIVIDELDRCRPSFALETLEKIKHIFQVKNFKFILVYNTYILESIIEKTYGISNGNRYLEKFIQKPIPFDNSKNFSNWFVLELEYLKERNMLLKTKLQRFENDARIFYELKKVYSISLRDFQSLFATLANYHGIPSSPPEGDGDKVLLMIITFEIFKLLDNKKYVALKNIVENQGQLDVDSPDASMIFSLKDLLKCSATSQEVSDMFKNHISGAYNK